MIQRLVQTFCAALLLCVSTGAFAMSDAERYQLLAPVALYPDELLPELLTAARHPEQIRQAQRWASRQSSRLQHHPPYHWHSSVEVLISFPHLLSRMSEHSHWTDRLGRAYQRDPQATLTAIQTLRRRAWERGSLRRMDHQRAYDHRGRIVIESRHRHELYAPYYDPRQLYGKWPWRQHPPYYWPAPRRYQSGFYWEYGIADEGQFSRWQIQWEHGRIVHYGHRRGRDQWPERRHWDWRAAPSIGSEHPRDRARWRRSTGPAERYHRPGRGLDAGADHSHVLPHERRRPTRQRDAERERERHSLLPGR